MFQERSWCSGFESPCGAGGGGLASAETAFLRRLGADFREVRYTLPQRVRNASYNVKQKKEKCELSREVLTEGTAPPATCRTSSAQHPICISGNLWNLQ